MNKSSDPFFKTKTIKKNLNPEWNETGNVEISNRVNDYLYVKLYDKDVASGDDLLGEAIFPLSHIDPDNVNGNEFSVDMLDPDSGNPLIVDQLLHLRFEISS